MSRWDSFAHTRDTYKEDAFQNGGFCFWSNLMFYFPISPFLTSLFCRGSLKRLFVGELSCEITINDNMWVKACWRDLKHEHPREAQILFTAILLRRVLRGPGRFAFVIREGYFFELKLFCTVAHSAVYECVSKRENLLSAKTQAPIARVACFWFTIAFEKCSVYEDVSTQSDNYHVLNSRIDALHLVQFYKERAHP